MTYLILLKFLHSGKAVCMRQPPKILFNYILSESLNNPVIVSLQSKLARHINIGSLLCIRKT